ncbi:MAG: SoxR reducing system RseC family protein [Gammaproteobacteria bacterium]
MIEEQAEVTEVDGQYAWVACRAQQDCARCAAGQGCGGGLLGRWLGNRLQRVRVTHDGSVRVGECVVIGVDDRVVLRAAAIVYGVPLVALGAGALIGEAVSGSDAGAFGGLVMGLAAGFLWVRSFSRKIPVQRWFQPAVLRRAPEEFR